MILYGDTSALAKKYLEEAGSETVADLMSRASTILTSALTELELMAGIERAKRIGRIASPLYRGLFQALEIDFRGKIFSLVDIGGDIIDSARRLIRQRHLRAPDAIQLASAIDLNKKLNQEIHFLCSDKALLEAARLEGLRCHDVSK